MWIKKTSKCSLNLNFLNFFLIKEHQLSLNVKIGNKYQGMIYTYVFKCGILNLSIQIRTHSLWGKNTSCGSIYNETESSTLLIVIGTGTQMLLVIQSIFVFRLSRLAKSRTTSATGRRDSAPPARTLTSEYSGQYRTTPPHPPPVPPSKLTPFI